MKDVEKFIRCRDFEFFVNRVSLGEAQKIIEKSAGGKPLQKDIKAIRRDCVWWSKAPRRRPLNQSKLTEGQWDAVKKAVWFYRKELKGLNVFQAVRVVCLRVPVNYQILNNLESRWHVWSGDK